MTATTAAPPAAAVAEKPKKGKKLIVIIVAVVLLLGGGGAAYKFLLAGPSTPAQDPAKVPGQVVTLDPITLNLADGHYLKLTLALQLSEAAAPATGSVDAAAATAPAVDGAKALDAAIAIFGEHTYNQLIDPKGRLAAQKQVTDEVKKRYDGDVLGVYYTQFLMQ